MVWLARTSSPGGTCRPLRLREDHGQPLYRWRRDGLFEQLLAEVHRRADACGELDWLCHNVDGSVIRAHQHAAGACPIPSIEDVKGDHTPPDETLGRRRGQVHQGCTCGSRAPGGRWSPGHSRPAPQGHPPGGLLDAGVVKPSGSDGGQGGSAAQAASQAGRGQGFLVPSARQLLRRRGIRSVIPPSRTSADSPASTRPPTEAQLSAPAASDLGAPQPCLAALCALIRSRSWLPRKMHCQEPESPALSPSAGPYSARRVRGQGGSSHGHDQRSSGATHQPRTEAA
jgi:hypothetical protein